MPYFIFRFHLLPMDNKQAELQVKEMYEQTMKEKGVVPTNWEVNRMIRKKWKRSDMFHDVAFTFQVKNAKMQFDAIAADSMDDKWMKTKPVETEYIVYGRICFSPAICSICLEQFGVKIRLHNCKCIFHKKCITQAVKYNDGCPTCDCTIYKKKFQINDAKKQETKKKKE